MLSEEEIQEMHEMAGAIKEMDNKHSYDADAFHPGRYSGASIIGTKYEHDFEVNDDIANAIISTYNPSKLKDNDATRYTIANIDNQSMLVAMLEDGTVDYTIPMDREVEAAVKADNFQNAIELLQDSTKEYKKVRTIILGALFMSCLIAGGIVLLLLTK